MIPKLDIELFLSWRSCNSFDSNVRGKLSRNSEDLFYHKW